MSELRNVVKEAVVASPAPQVALQVFLKLFSPNYSLLFPKKRAFSQGAKKSLEIPGKHTKNKSAGREGVCLFARENILENIQDYFRSLLYFFFFYPALEVFPPCKSAGKNGHFF